MYITKQEEDLIRDFFKGDYELSDIEKKKEWYATGNIGQLKIWFYKEKDEYRFSVFQGSSFSSDETYKNKELYKVINKAKAYIHKYTTTVLERFNLEPVTSDK